MRNQTQHHGSRLIFRTKARYGSAMGEEGKRTTEGCPSVQDRQVHTSCGRARPLGLLQQNYGDGITAVISVQ